jgi:hypothetical protein
MAAGPKELPGGLTACQHNRSPPIPCRATARISISGRAVGRMRHATFRTACGWWNASKPFLREMLALPLSRRPCADTATTFGFSAVRSSAGCRWTVVSAGGRSAGRPRPHRRRRRAATLPWRVRNRATLLRRNLPQAVSLPDRPRDQPRHNAQALPRRRTDRVIDGTNAERSRPCVSRSSPAAAKRCAAGAGLDRDPHGRGTIGRAVRCVAASQLICTVMSYRRQTCGSLYSVKHPQFPQRNP